jgi:hypothetical protein
MWGLHIREKDIQQDNVYSLDFQHHVGEKYRKKVKAMIKGIKKSHSEWYTEAMLKVTFWTFFCSTFCSLLLREKKKIKFRFELVLGCVW